MAFDFDEVAEDLKYHRYDFRINDLDESLEVKVGSRDWERYNDTHEAVLKTKLRGDGYGSTQKCGMGALDHAIVTLGHTNRYNPIKSYLENLRGTYKPIKGETHLKRLSTYFGNPDGQFHDWLFYWMVGTIAKIFTGQRNPMLVLVGPQRSGKSYFCKWLCPVEKRFLRSPIRPDQKDNKLHLVDVMVWEVEELGATTRRTDVESLKHFITLDFIFERFPYGKHPLHKPATASFIGTVNYDGAGFLNDPTGTTRFLACEIEQIDFDYSKLDRNQLWAEAMHFYDTIPEIWRMTPEDEAKQAEINQKYEMPSALEDAFEAEFIVTAKQDDFITTLEIKELIKAHYRITNEQAFANEIGRILNAKGAWRGRLPASQGQKRGWHGVARNLQTPADAF